MKLAIEEIKIKAKKLLKQVKTMEASELGREPKLMSCQQYLARHLGFKDFTHARAVLAPETGLSHNVDFGTMWYAPGCVKFTNQWFSTYAEAKEVQGLNPFYLLPYKRQFLLVEQDFLLYLGLTQQELQLLEQSDKDLVAAYPSEYWDKLALMRIQAAVDVEKLTEIFSRE